ncbi:YcaO-like family protein [Streptomyces sp. PR69]|uniref:YcaO-like family protein n=1 Tax=Streptomyces sp. PR69 TaxID=2984950 RepID=UPI0022653E7F|nr:YcaO-like family protein [Streptomyces sp. PR69]
MCCGDDLLDGTERARCPEDTWAALAPQLPRFGITRVARLTGLDYLGLPVWTAIRPAAETLAASQGKGATDLLAKISAVMEAVELWHAEQPMTPLFTVPACDVDLPYPLAALPVRVWHDGLTGVALDWTAGTGVRSGRAVPLPMGLVERSASQPVWKPDVFRPTSTGLACGNTRDEALLHALYEVIERDALHTDEVAGGGHRTLITPESVTESYNRRLVQRLAAARVDVELAVVDNAYGLPVCLAYIWSEDYPVWFAGSGCHSSPHIALARAITEAAQSRLTCIAGTRDDLPSHAVALDAAIPHPRKAKRSRPWGELMERYRRRRGRFASDVHTVATRIERVTGYEPMCVDLSEPDSPVAAVKVICPGARSRTGRAIPR